MTTEARLLGAAFGAALLAGAAAPAVAQEVTIRFATPVPEGQWIYERDLKGWKEAVETQSDGRIKVELAPVGVFGSPDRYLELVEGGVIDAAWFVPGYAPGRFERTGVVELPFMFESGQVASEVYWQLYEEGLLGEEYDSIEPLALFMNTPYILMTRHTPIDEVSDMEGLKMRASGRMIGAVMEAMGAAAVGMPASEMAEAIRLGVLDGTVFSYEAVKPFGLDALIEEFNEIPLASITHIFIMNKDKYEALPDDLKKVIDENSGAAWSSALGASYDAADAELRKPFVDNPDFNINTPAPELVAEMREATSSVVDDWLARLKEDGVDGQAILDRATALREEKR